MGKRKNTKFIVSDQCYDIEFNYSWHVSFKWSITVSHYLLWFF